MESHQPATPQPTIAAVLAGGVGRRLGGAKAATLLAGKPLISYPLEAALAGGLETVVIAKHSTPLPPLQVPLIEEPDLPLHPLCGVLRALTHATELDPPARGVLLLACDMPFLTPELLGWLGGLEGAVMPEVEGRPQPLLARCEPRHRPELQQSLEAESSLTAAMLALGPRIIEEGELSRFGVPEQLCFNVNDLDDLQAAEEWLS
jgi:molybdopterin-guanine dinucleotide biosynthesis protein A